MLPGSSTARQSHRPVSKLWRIPISIKSSTESHCSNCGVINPEVIEEYIGTGGYQALGKVLTEMTPDEVIQTLLDSGLRGQWRRRLPDRP